MNNSLHAAAVFANVDQTSPIYDTAKTDEDGTVSDDTIETTIDVIQGGMAIAAAASGTGGNYTWAAGWTEMTDIANSGTVRMSTAEYTATATGTGIVVRTRFWSNAVRQALSVVSLRPSSGGGGGCEESFAYRKRITIDHTKVGGTSDLIDYPVLVKLTGTDFQEIEDNTRSDGYDIVFRASDGTTPLPHEIEVYDETNDELVAWVRIPNLSTTADTEIYLYYGSSCVTTPTETPNDVWDSNFRGVWHMKEDPTSIGPQFMDSTANNNHGTALYSTDPFQSSDRVAGKIGPALHFDYTSDANQRVDVPDDPSLDLTTAITLEAWVKPDYVQAADRYLLYKGGAYFLDAMRAWSSNSHLYIHFEDGNWRACATNQDLTTDWNYLVVTYDSAARIMRAYLDGVLMLSKTPPSVTIYTFLTSAEPFLIGRSFDGIIDEARVSAIPRSAEWVQTSYNNQSSPSTFYTVAAEEGLDPDAPSIAITSPTERSTYETSTGTINLAGVASGTWGIVDVTWSNADTGGSGACSGTNNWSKSIALAEGTNVITVTATDSKGNAAIDVISVNYSPPPPDPDPEPEPEPDPESNPDPDAPGDTEIFSSTLDPNVMILIDTSGSMNSIMSLDEYHADVDYTAPLLSQGKNVVFAGSSGCITYFNYVEYTTSQGKARLTYHNYDGNICNAPQASQYSESDGYFYFDRGAGQFISAASYNTGNPDHIKVWLPYAEYSVDPPSNFYKTMYDYNYLNWIFYYSSQSDRDALEAQHWVPEQRAILTRILAAKKAVKNLIESTVGVRFGLMKFRGDNTGGEILADIPSDKATLNAALDGLSGADSMTPLGEALEDAWDYFRGVDVGGHSFTLDYYCRRNFVIVMTDGMPTGDGNDLSAYIKKDWDGDSGGTEANGWTGDEDGVYPAGGSDYLDDVAFYMQHNDAWTDEAYPGVQNVSTYTIGFAFDFGLLSDTATNGGGLYYTSDNFQALCSAFQNIVQEIIDVNYSYSAPVVPVSQMERTTQGTNIYLALFKPTLDAFWKGNIKKYGIATASVGEIKRGDILDRNGVRAANDSGFIYDTAHSYWGSGDPDGGDAAKGGVGEVLLNRATPRNIYTWLDETSVSLTDTNNAFTTGNTLLTKERLAAIDDEEKNKIIDFIHGKDAYDDDGDSDTDEKRDWILGDFLHSRPVVVSYDDDTTVIFAGANDGMLHAFWDGDTAIHDGGSELWAYIPPPLLTKLKYLAGSSHGYFVDGSPQVYVEDNNDNGDIDAGDKAILICGLRRGGRAYFALDITDPHNPKIPTGWSKWGMWESTTVWRPSGMIGAEMSLTAADKSDATFPYSEMGQSWSTPVFGEINYEGSPKHVAFISAGYDNVNQDQASPSLVDEDMGRGIYVVDPLTGDRLWRYTKYPDDMSLDWSIPSDITAIDTTDNGYIDRLYVGDMGGRVWRFDIGSSATANWSGKIIFDANALDSAGRKIFYPPDVSLEKDYEMVFFATGDRAHPKNGTPINRFYAVKDTNPVSTLDEGDLKDVTDDCLQDPDCMQDKDALRNEILSGNGWYVRLADNLGEKALAAPLVFGGVVYFTTFTPTNVDDPCTFQEGIGRLYALDYRTGEAYLNYDATTEGLTKSDRSMIIGNAIPSRVVVALINGQPEAYVGIRGGIVNPELGEIIPLLRIYWREL